MRCIDALQLLEVLNGSKWIVFPTSNGMLLPTQTIAVVGDQLRWCDGVYEPTAMHPSFFSSEAHLTLRRLLGECVLVDAKKWP